MHDIFISYNHRDKSFVEFLVRLLEKAGLVCFQDTAGLKIFDKLDAKLKAAIAQSRWLVATISPNYLQSYWCLFEALEAIQGQDLEQRFLPIVLRYTPTDQKLDEDFVLKALSDLDAKIKDFEVQMIQAKAYELSPKLEKLNFVKSHLPGVFRQIQDRIYPELALWDNEATRTQLGKIIARLAPDAHVDVEAIPFDFERLAAMPVVIPRLAELPSVLWKAKVGHQAWKNSPVVCGDDILVGSAGRQWNQADGEDGVYCLDAKTGAIKWLAPTPIDANRVLVSKGIVVTGCDDGSVVAMSARDGSRVWSVRLDSGIVGGPIWPSANDGDLTGGRPGERLADLLLVVTYGGSVCLLDLHTGEQVDRLDLGHRVLAAPVALSVDDHPVVLIPGLDGNLLFVQYDSNAVRCSTVRAVALHCPDEHSAGGISAARLAAEPAVVHGLILQGLVCQTGCQDPPLVALDANSGDLRWEANAASDYVIVPAPRQTQRGDVRMLDSAPSKAKRSFGNLRCAPAVVGREAIVAAAYSVVCAVSLDDGNVLWALDLDRSLQQWSGPVASGRSVYLGRHDGYLHKIDCAKRRREWSVFLGDNAYAGLAVSGDRELPDFNLSAPILATPILGHGRLYIGTSEGYLYCLTNLGEDPAIQ